MKLLIGQFSALKTLVRINPKFRYNNFNYELYQFVDMELFKEQEIFPRRSVKFADVYVTYDVFGNFIIY